MVANDIYKEILSQLDSHQANIASLSFIDIQISSRLQFSLPQTKFKELLTIIKPSVTSPIIVELIQYITDTYKGRFSELMSDKTIKALVENSKTLLMS